MGVFDDKKFEQLDWMTQITETIESDLNEILAQLPDRVDFNTRDILSHAGSYSSFSISADNVVHDLVQGLPGKRRLSWEESRKICECFRFESSEDLEVDLGAGTMVGTLTLVKFIPTLPDEELQSLMGGSGIQNVGRINFAENWPLDRMNEMLDVLGKCEEAQKNRSYKKKIHRLKARLKEIFTTNEWRIRDMELADKIGTWVAEYISTGNLAALTNLCKLKVMTHNNMPIYSIEEEK
jgi:hypothetical protein